MRYLDEAALGFLRPHLKEFEGCRLEAYADIAGVLTIGYGHTGPDVFPGMKISQTAADHLLDEDLVWVDDVMALTIKAPLSPRQKAGFAGLIFNIGAGAWRSSTALKRLNNGNIEGAAEALTWFNKATVGGVKKTIPGLARRREAERAMVLPAAFVEVSEDAPTTAKAEAEEAKSLLKSKEAGIGVFGILGSIVAMWEKAQELFPPDMLETVKEWAPLGLCLMFAVIAGNRIYARYRGDR